MEHHNLRDSHSNQVFVLSWLNGYTHTSFAERREPLRRIDAISFTFWRTLLQLLQERYSSFTKARNGRIKKRSSKFSVMGTTSSHWELNHEVSLDQMYKLTLPDHVAMDFTNKPEFLFVMYGLLCIGAIPAIINFNLISTPLIHCITAANAKMFVFDSEIAANVAGIKDVLAVKGIRSICLIDSDGVPPKEDVSWAQSVTASSIEAQSSSERPPDTLRSGPKLVDMEMLMYTSGTTGLPKPAIISFNKMGFAPILFLRWAHFTPKDRLFSCMPLCHATALILGACLMVRAQGTYIIGRKFKTKTFWKEVRESKATVIQYVGEMCRYLLSTPPSDQDKNHLVRMAVGNGMRPDVWNRFRYRFGVDTIAELYAATGHPLDFGLLVC